MPTFSTPNPPLARPRLSTDVVCGRLAGKACSSTEQGQPNSSRSQDHVPRWLGAAGCRLLLPVPLVPAPGCTKAFKWSATATATPLRGPCTRRARITGHEPQVRAKAEAVGLCLPAQARPPGGTAALLAAWCLGPLARRCRLGSVLALPQAFKRCSGTRSKDQVGRARADRLSVPGTKHKDRVAECACDRRCRSALVLLRSCTSDRDCQESGRACG